MSTKKEVTEKSFSIREMIKEFNLEIISPGENLDYKLDGPNIYRTGPELTGYFDEDSQVLEDHIHIFGKEEVAYLESLCRKKRRTILEGYFSYSFPAIILTYGAELDDDSLEIIERRGKPILASMMSTSNLIRDMKYYLQKRLAPEMIIEDHILLEIFGMGIMITGYHEAKIGATIELIERGHKYITDEYLVLQRTGDNQLLGVNGFDKSDPDKHFFLVNKDGSKIDITDSFGVGATRKEKQVNLIINLEKWDEKKFYDRLGVDRVYENLLGVNIPTIDLPVRKGRNLAVIIETAAINERLKVSGTNSAEYFLSETRRLIMENKKRNQGENSMKNHVSLSVRELKEKFDLEVICGGEKLEDTYIYKTSIHRPALALSGYYDTLEEDGPDRIQVFSEGEFGYLESLPEEIKIDNLTRYLEYNFPAIVLAGVKDVPEYFIEAVREAGLVLLMSNKRKTSQIIADFNSFLEAYFAPAITLHGVFVEMYGFGVLLTGKSGIGKSETALELIHRGHRLVADDMVKFIKHPSGDIVGRAARLPHFMEIRGLGIIDIKTLYGLGAVRLNKRLDAILELREQKTEDYLSSAKFSGGTMEILGDSVYKAELYISSGRNAAAMVEIATMNLMAKKLGHDPEKAYREGVARFSQEEKKILGLDK